MKTLCRAILFLAIGLASPGAWGLTGEEGNNIEIYKKSAPGVVNITSIVMERDFFLGLVPREGAGSGVIIDDRGHVLTNNHVIKDARRLEVILADGSKWRGRLVGTDPHNDLAVIRIDAKAERLHPLPLGSSRDLQVGQKVIAIGNPFGLQQTLTTGIISSLGRSIGSEHGVLMEGLIQTDAAINPGNSGGPLLDSSGKIIGINTAIFSPSGGSVGIGFAIPVDAAKEIIPDLIKRGYVAHPWLGVTLFPLFPGLAKELGLKAERGALILETVRGGPADRAGLRGGSRILNVGNALLPIGGDLVVGFQGKAVDSSNDLITMISRHKPDDRVQLRILRSDSFLDVAVTLGERPRSP